MNARIAANAILSGMYINKAIHTAATLVSLVEYSIPRIRKADTPVIPITPVSGILGLAGTP